MNQRRVLQGKVLITQLKISTFECDCIVNFKVQLVGVLRVRVCVRASRHFTSCLKHSCGKSHVWIFITLSGYLRKC